MTERLPQVFNYQNDQQVRTLTIDNQPWFVAKDVCEALEIKDVRRAVERLDDDERSLTPLVDSIGKKQEMYVVNEPGLYSLILGSRKQEAKNFKRWITHDVIPSIRQKGIYVQTTDVQVPELLSKVNELETKLNSFVTLDSHEQQMLQKAISRRVYEVIQDADVRKLGFSELHREIKDRFGVPSYRDVAKLDFHIAMSYVKAWVPKKVAA